MTFHLPSFFKLSRMTNFSQGFCPKKALKAKPLSGSCTMEETRVRSPSRGNLGQAPQNTHFLIILSLLSHHLPLTSWAAPGWKPCRSTPSPVSWAPFSLEFLGRSLLVNRPRFHHLLYHTHRRRTTHHTRCRLLQWMHTLAGEIMVCNDRDQPSTLG